MITIQTLEIDGFGPYRDKQVLALGEGLAVITGNNGHGKTSLFRALSFALYGKPAGQDSDLSKYLNNQLRDRGVEEFKVSVTVSDAESKWEIVRTWNKGDVDLQVRKDNDNPLPPDEAVRVVEGLFSPDLVDFVFFDAERLRQYQQAQDADRSDTKRVRTSIERILGLPLLPESAKAVAGVRDSASVQIEAKSNDKNRAKEYRERQTAQEAERQTIESDIAATNDLIERKEAEQRTLEDKLTESDLWREANEELQAMMGKLSAHQASAEEARQTLRDLGAYAWVAPAAQALEEARSSLDKEIEELLLGAGRARAFAEIRTAIAETGRCPVCQSAVVGGSANDEGLGDTEVNTDEVTKRMQRVAADKEQIEAILRNGSLDALEAASAALAKANSQVAMAEQKIQIRKADMNNLGVSEYAMADLIRKRLLIEETLKEAHADLEKHETRRGEVGRAIQDTQTEINKLDTDAPDSVVNIHSVTNALVELFDTAERRSRELARESIEAEASEFFARVSANPSHAGLTLDKDYRASVLTHAGSEAPEQSSGYQQLVVLSLVSAFMSISPTPGPVVMDMPFGRLDSEITSTVAQAFPDLSHQVILHVFPGEIGANTLGAINERIAGLFTLKQEDTSEDSPATWVEVGAL